MKINAIDLVKEFYEKEGFEDLSFEEVKNICYSPFRYLRKSMSSEDLPEVRIMYFGIFKVHKGRAKYMLQRAKENFKKGYMSEKRYTQIKTMVKNLLNRD